MGKSGNYEKFIPENEEIRCGFKVSSNRKKVWNVELGLLEELKRICKKYNIKYYASGGTLLGAIRHKGYIPWDDDLDVVMFREDLEKFYRVAQKELPSYIEFGDYCGKFPKLTNKNTAALCDDYIGGIRIDIFPLDYESKFSIINRIKHKMLYFLGSILCLKNINRSTDKVRKWIKPFIPLCKGIFGKIDYSKIYKIRQNIQKKVLFKGKKIRSAGFDDRVFPENIYNGSHDVKFENTTICIPDGFDAYLTIGYGNYMKPVISPGGHNCRYSVDKSYKDIIKTFDKSKLTKDNYNDCKDLFLL